MAAPVLTLAEQKCALRGTKRRINTKNILCIPEDIQVESQILQDSKIEKLTNILERLLPVARLPSQPNLKRKSATAKETALKKAAQFKRKQLSLGVNDVNKSIKKGLIAAVLLADDIEPKFLVRHLNLLCHHNKIPYLHLVGLRKLTNACLGFPCIALGFKKDSYFLEAINEIKDISVDLEKSKECEKSDTGVTDWTESEKLIEEDVKNDDDDDDEDDEDDEDDDDEPPFTYLYRSSTKERVFVPGKGGNDKKAEDFIAFDKSENVRLKKKVSGTSLRFTKEKRKRKLKSKKDSSSDEDSQIPKKKQKKNRVVNKKEVKPTPKPKYHPVNLIKVSSNPNRVSRKRKR